MKLVVPKLKNLSGLFLFICLLGAFLFLLPLGVFAAQNLGDYSVFLGDNDHPHNFSSNSGATIHDTSGAEDRICVFCHTPHNASSKGALWNRVDPTGPVSGAFPMYGELSGRLGEIAIDGIAAAQYAPGDRVDEYPNGASRLCLSCHDGVTAVGEVINPGSGSSPLGGLGSIPSENVATTAVVDLDSSHPISFVYNGTVKDAINLVKGDGTEYDLPAAGILDSNSRVQCTSCHDPHLDTADTATGYTLPMWRAYTNDLNEALDYTATCSECHVGGESSGGLFNTNPATLHPIP